MVLVLFACTKEVGMEDVQKDTIVNDVEALTDADRALYSLTTMLDDVAPQTRMTSGQTIKAQTLINVSDIIAEEYSDVAGYDNAFYLVTLENENGVASTAFLGATPNLPSVIAIINGVEYTIEDCCEACAEIFGYEYIAADDTITRSSLGTGTPGLIVPPIVPPISTIIGTPSVPWDPGTPSDPDPEVPLPDIPTDPGNFTATSETHYRIITKVDPLMKSHFHQGWPFNEKNEFKDDSKTERYAAGCVVIAIAQIMTYNKLVKGEGIDNWKNKNIEWNHIASAVEKQHQKYQTSYLNISKNEMGENKYSDEEIEALAAFIDLIADEVVTEYADDGTSSTISRAKSFFSDIGFVNVDKQSYDLDKIRIMIMDKELPVYIRGMCSDSNCSSGHAWVVDGWYQREKVEITTLYRNGNPVSATTTVLGIEKYLHYNWGWSTGQDGYYADGVFDTMNVFLSTSVGVRNNPMDHNYDNSVKILTYDSAL